jgi:hypothetical protein
VTHKVHPSANCVQEAKVVSRDIHLFRKAFGAILKTVSSADLTCSGNTGCSHNIKISERLRSECSISTRVLTWALCYVVFKFSFTARFDLRGRDFTCDFCVLYMSTLMAVQTEGHEVGKEVWSGFVSMSNVEKR